MESAGRKPFGLRPPLWLCLGVTVALVVASTLQKLPCLRGRADTDVLATRQCYSDAPLFYVGRGLAADFGWLGHLPSGYGNLEYPPLINVFIEAVGKATHAVMGIPGGELERRTTLSADALYSQPGMAGEERVFFLISCLGILVAATVTVHAVWRAGWRVGDRAIWLMLAPLLVLTLTVNWDAIAIAFTALALIAWERSRWVAFGAWVALGTATKLFPLVLLAAALILLFRHRQWRPAVAAIVSFACVSVLANAPLLMSSKSAWLEFWQVNADRPSSFGSVWMALRMVSLPTTPDQLTLALAGGMAATWLLCAALTWWGWIKPSLAELATVFLLAFFILGKVFSPQYSLWVVLALVLVTRSRLLIGSVVLAETFHYVATWLYIRGITTPESGVDKTYWFSILLRLAVEVGVVVAILMQSARRAAGPRGEPASTPSHIPLPLPTAGQR